MKNKKERLTVISEILHLQVVGSQEELLEILREKNYDITQATLSRDLKTLKVSKMPLSNGSYKYILPPNIKIKSEQFESHGAVLSLDFSGQLAILKTKPGYANAVAWDIDNRATDEVLATIAGDDTILIVPREDVTRDELKKAIDIIFKEK